MAISIWETTTKLHVNYYLLRKEAVSAVAVSYTHLGVCIVHQDKAIGNRHGDPAELVIRFCVIQTKGVVDARIVARQIDAALLQNSR